MFDLFFARLLRKPGYHCATYDRWGGMNDINFCRCQHITHATRIITSENDAIEVESL